jgi:hypothetical protein
MEAMPGSHEFSDVASPPSQTLGFDKYGDVGVAVFEAPIGDGVANSGLLPTVPRAARAVVAREVCDFLATLVVAFLGSVVG